MGTAWVTRTAPHYYTRSMSYKKQCKNELVVFLIFPQFFNSFWFLMLKK